MRLSLDGKSVALGAFAGAAFIAGLGAMQAQKHEIGRFHFSVIGSGGGAYDGFVMDTATGQVWTNREEGFREPKVGVPN